MLFIPFSLSITELETMFHLLCQILGVDASFKFSENPVGFTAALTEEQFAHLYDSLLINKYFASKGVHYVPGN